MFVHVTQIIPNGTQQIEINTDLLEDVQPWQGHIMLVMQSGHDIEISETQEQWDTLVKGA
jgi:hypothetical protein